MSSDSHVSSSIPKSETSQYSSPLPCPISLSLSPTSPPPPSLLSSRPTASCSTRVILIGFTIAMSAFFFGYDTGVINVAMIFAIKNENLDISAPFWQGLVVSATPALAGLGSLVAAPLSDKLGRRNVIGLSTVIYTLAGLCAAASHYRGILVVARIINGFAIGLACMLAPLYLSECSPASIRGQMLTSFQLAANFGVIMSNVIAAGVSKFDPVNVGWRLLFAFPCLLAVVQLTALTFLPESPSWIFEHKTPAQAMAALEKIHGSDHRGVSDAFEDIIEEHNERTRVGSRRCGLARIFTTGHVIKPLILGSLLQIFNIGSGINTIMYYIGTTVKSVGITDELSAIWFSLATSCIVLIFGLVPFFTIDRFGRRPTLIASQFGCFFALLAIAGAYWQVSVTTGVVAPQAPKTFLSLRCSQHLNCASCVKDPFCKFCGPSDIYGSSSGFCLSPAENSTCQNPTGVSGWSFYDGYCHTPWSWLPLVCVLVFLAVFSSGLASLPWVLNAEFFPLWARSTCVAITTSVNWWTNLLVSMTFLSLVDAVTQHGAYILYAGVTLIGALICCLFLPETKGLQLDQVQQLFITDNKDVVHSSRSPHVHFADAKQSSWRR